jgi:protein CpxP
MENIKFYKVAVAFLLLLNVGTLAFIWVHRPPPPGEKGPFMFLVKATGMDDGQQAVYSQLRQIHQSKMEGNKKQSTTLHRQLFDLLAQHGVSDPEVQQLIDSIASVKREEELLTYTHFRNVRELCRPDQQGKFDAAIGEAIQTIRPPRMPNR